MKPADVKHNAYSENLANYEHIAVDKNGVPFARAANKAGIEKAVAAAHAADATIMCAKDFGAKKAPAKKVEPVKEPTAKKEPATKKDDK